MRFKVFLFGVLFALVGQVYAQCPTESEFQEWLHKTGVVSKTFFNKETPVSDIRLHILDMAANHLGGFNHKVREVRLATSLCGFIKAATTVVVAHELGHALTAADPAPVCRQAGYDKVPGEYREFALERGYAEKDILDEWKADYLAGPLLEEMVGEATYEQVIERMRPHWPVARMAAMEKGLADFKGCAS